MRCRRYEGGSGNQICTRDSLYVYKFLAIVCIELILAFSSVGYIVVEPVSLTFVHIPVLIGALVLGPVEGMLLGGLFGLTSVWKASVTAVAYSDQIFSPFISGKPLESLIMGIGIRMLFGLAAGILYGFVLKKIKYKKAGIGAVTIAATFLHSVWVGAAMQFWFPKAGLTACSTVEKIGTWDNLLDWGTAVLILLGIYMLEQSAVVRELREVVSDARGRKGNRERGALVPAFLFGLVVFLAVCMVWHCFTRFELVLKIEEIPVPRQASGKFMQIILQFLTAMIAIGGLLVIGVRLFGLYSQNIQEKSKRDLMTGLYHKNGMTDWINQEFGQRKPEPEGIFLMMDVDNFKNVNDTYGHPFGDQVLIRIAGILNEVFTPEDVIGRLGGDEFCVYRRNSSPKELEELAGCLAEKISRIRTPDGKTGRISCSIGIAFCGEKTSFMQLYQEADQALYHVKRNGKKSYYFCEKN